MHGFVQHDVESLACSCFSAVFHASLVIFLFSCCRYLIRLRAFVLPHFFSYLALSFRPGLNGYLQPWLSFSRNMGLFRS